MCIREDDEIARIVCFPLPPLASLQLGETAYFYCWRKTAFFVQPIQKFPTFFARRVHIIYIVRVIHVMILHKRRAAPCADFLYGSRNRPSACSRRPCVYKYKLIFAVHLGNIPLQRTTTNRGYRRKRIYDSPYGPGFFLEVDRTVLKFFYHTNSYLTQ